jgi:hypothetical protein
MFDVLPYLRKVMLREEEAKLTRNLCGSIYAELWVAEKLCKYEPQMYNDRDVTESDIYLPTTKKKIEVKHSIWGKSEKKYGSVKYASWVFGIKQVKDGKFDYAVVIADSRKNIKPEDVFVFTIDEIKMWHEKSINGKPGYYLCKCKNYEDFKHLMKEWEYHPSEVGKKLNKNPQPFRKRWKNLIETGKIN